VANVFENSGYWCTGNPGGVCGSGANQACPCRKSVVITVSTPTPTPTLTPTPTVTPTLTPTLTLSYYTIAGYIVDSTTGTGISGDSVSIYDDALKQTVTVTTNSTGRFTSPSNWARKGDYYAVRPQTPSGYVGPPGSTTVGWTWNHCTSTDTPLGSSSYECQIVSVNDCAGPSGSGVTERCNFSLTPVSPTPAPIPGDVDKNGRVDGLDVIYLISYLGNIGTCPSCDLDHNSRVDGLDVIMLIGYL